MTIIIEGEFIDGIKLCDNIKYLFEDFLVKCTFNFNIVDNWIEFYLTLNRRLTIHQLNTALIFLNEQNKKLQKKGWSRFQKINEKKWIDAKGRLVYSYLVRSSRIIQEVKKQMEEIKEEKNLCCKETIQKCPTAPQLTKIPNAKPTPRFNFEPIAKPRINVKP